MPLSRDIHAMQYKPPKLYQMTFDLIFSLLLNVWLRVNNLRSCVAKKQARAINDAYCSRSLATFRQHSLPTGKLDVHSIICAPFSKLLAMWVKLLKPWTYESLHTSQPCPLLDVQSYKTQIPKNMPRISLLYPICIMYFIHLMYYIILRHYFVKLDGKFSKISKDFSG